MHENNDKRPTATRSSAGVVVLQWLSYAFWGWFIIAFIWLFTVVLMFFMVDKGSSTDAASLPYALAANIVLLPVAYLTDFFYRRHEPLKKAGAATVVMVLHSVLYALIAIGTLIGAVFIGLNMLVDTTSAEKTVGLITTFAAAVLYGLLLLRVLYPFKTSRMSLIYGLTMLVLAVVLIGFGIFGPLVSAIIGRDDKMVEDNLSNLTYSIQSYTRQHNQLPGSLTDLSSQSSDVQTLIDSGKVRYQKENPAISEVPNYSSYSTNKNYYYQLCVTYKHENSARGDYYGGGYDNYGDGGVELQGTAVSSYTSDLTTKPHAAGDVCYKQTVAVYNYSPISNLNSSIGK